MSPFSVFSVNIIATALMIVFFKTLQYHQRIYQTLLVKLFLMLMIVFVIGFYYGWDKNPINMWYEETVVLPNLHKLIPITENSTLELIEQPNFFAIGYYEITPFIFIISILLFGWGVCKDREQLSFEKNQINYYAISFIFILLLILVFISSLRFIISDEIATINDLDKSRQSFYSEVAVIFYFFIVPLFIAYFRRGKGKFVALLGYILFTCYLQILVFLISLFTNGESIVNPTNMFVLSGVLYHCAFYTFFANAKKCIVFGALLILSSEYLIMFYLIKNDLIM